MCLSRTLSLYAKRIDVLQYVPEPEFHSTRLFLQHSRASRLAQQEPLLQTVFYQLSHAISLFVSDDVHLVVYRLQHRKCPIGSISHNDVSGSIPGLSKAVDAVSNRV